MTSNFIVYMIGYALVIAGVAYGMVAADLSQEWVVAVVLILAGFGIVYAFARSQTDAASRPSSSSETRSRSQSSASSPESEGSAERRENSGIEDRA